MTTTDRWKGLNRAKGYINPYDVWAKHPDRPAMIDTRSQLGGIGGNVGKWELLLPRPDAKPEELHKVREGKRFKTFKEATAWAAANLGVKGWEFANVNRMGAWYPNDEMPDAEACEADVSHDYSYSVCGKPAVGVAPGGLLHSREDVPACKAHVTAERKRQERREEQRIRSEQFHEQMKNDREARTRSEENEKAAEDYAARLRGFGIKADVAWDKERHCHGSVAVQGETAVRMAEEIEMLRRELGLPGLDEDPIR